MSEIKKIQLMDAADSQLANVLHPETDLGSILVSPNGGGGNFIITNSNGDGVEVSASTLADVPYSFEIGRVTTIEPKEDAYVNSTNNNGAITVDFGVPKGDPGHNPNRGTYILKNNTPSGAPTTGNEPGDFIVVLDNTDPNNVTGTVWTWDTSLVTPAWTDTGRDSNDAMFASGELLTQVNIDNVVTNPADTDVAGATVVMELKAKLGGLTATEMEATYTIESNKRFFEGKVENGDSGDAIAIIPVNGAKRIRFMGISAGGNSLGRMLCYGFFSSSETFDSTTRIKFWPSNNNETSTSLKEYIVDVPEGAVTFVTNSSRGGSNLASNFYCYLQFDDNFDTYKRKFESLFASTETDIQEIDSTSDSFYSGKNGDQISEVSNSSFTRKKYNVTQGYVYHYKGKFGSGVTNLFGVFFTDANGIVLEGRCCTINTIVDNFDNYLQAPNGAAYACVNIQDTYQSDYSFKEIPVEYKNIAELSNAVDYLIPLVKDIESNVDSINETLSIESQTPVEAESTISSQFYSGSVGSIISTKNSSSMKGGKYPIEEKTTYWYANRFGSGINVTGLFFTDVDGRIISKHFIGTSGQIDEWNQPIKSPEGAVYAYINYTQLSNVTFDTIEYAMVNVGELKDDVDTLKEQVESVIGDMLMKVVMSDSVFDADSHDVDNAYYIRTKYNDNEDILIQNKINGNGLLSFHAAYIGQNTLTDNQLRTTIYRAVDCHDSTAPFFDVNLYWHLYAQHGCPIPYVSNNVNMTPDSVGTIWEDTVIVDGRNRQYKIGYVNSSNIYLLPVFYEDTYGRMTRGWKSKEDSAAITSLNYIDVGTGTDEGIRSIQASGYDQLQKKPMLKHSNRHFIIDGKEITKAGTYYCNELKASESQVGYDPATIADADWFSSEGNRVNLDNGALPLVEFTWSYLYKGATCAMNTTIKILREIECDSYGALQQQYPWSSNGVINYNNKNYQIKLMIPKLKNKNIPFNQPGSYFTYYRTQEYLVDINDPVDRQIGWLVNQNDSNDYRVGLAAGLSLVSGDTVRVKRIQNMPIGDRPSGASSANRHWRLGSLSPASTTLNKFYIAAINTANYIDSQYHLPVGFFKEINCYVSYFDPSQNYGQVYWYKDGSNYIIYCHAQSASENQVINVPEYMEGLQLNVVEKTDDATLLSETITNGKLYVNYSGNGQSKYIVLKAH